MSSSSDSDSAFFSSFLDSENREISLIQTIVYELQFFWSGNSIRMGFNINEYLSRKMVIIKTSCLKRKTTQFLCFLEYKPFFSSAAAGAPAAAATGAAAPPPPAGIELNFSRPTTKQAWVIIANNLSVEARMANVPSE